MIATFKLLPKDKLEKLKTSEDISWTTYLYENSNDVAEYQRSGNILGTLITYLEEKQDIYLSSADYEDFIDDLDEETEMTCFVLTKDHKDEYLEKLAPKLFSEAELREFYNDFNQEDEKDSGLWMLDGIRSLRQSLEAIDEYSVILLLVG